MSEGIEAKPELSATKQKVYDAVDRLAVCRTNKSTPDIVRWGEYPTPVHERWKVCARVINGTGDGSIADESECYFQLSVLDSEDYEIESVSVDFGRPVTSSAWIGGEPLYESGAPDYMLESFYNRFIEGAFSIPC